MTEIAKRISKNVTLNVICGPVHLESSAFLADQKLPQNIIIQRVYVPNLPKNHLLGRTVRMIWLSVVISFTLLKQVGRKDKVILVTNPPLLLILVGLVQKIRGFNFLLIVHDVFPENAVSAGLMRSGSILFRSIKRVFDWAYNTANKLIVVGVDMKVLVESKTKRPVSVITNWADSNDIFPDHNDVMDFGVEHLLKDKVIIQFAGNIGRVQGLVEFVDLFHQVSNPNLLLLIIGEGAHKSQLKDLVASKCISNVIILDALPRNMQNKFLNSCHIGLVTLSKGMFGLGVPSKSYNILSAGKPILFIGDRDSEISTYIKTHDVGWAFTWENSAYIKAFLGQIQLNSLQEIGMKGTNARRMVEEKFTKDLILNLYQTEILSE